MIPRQHLVSTKWFLLLFALIGFAIASPAPAPADDTAVISPTGLITAQALSPDHTRLAVGGNRGVALLDSETFEPIWFSTADSSVDTLSFSSDGLFLASAHSDGSVMLWDAASGASIRQLNAPDTWNYFSPVSVGFSTSGDFLASVGSANGLLVWDIRPGTPDPSITPLDLPVDARAVFNYAWSPSGATLALQDTLFDCKFLDMSAEPPSIRQIKSGGRFGPWTPDGRRAVFSVLDGNLALRDIQESSVVYLFPAEPGYTLTGVAISPDGKRLALGYQGPTWGNPPPPPEGLLTLWDLDTGREVLRTVDSGYWINNLAFSPDGTQIATGSNAGTITLWDPSTLQVRQRLVSPDLAEDYVFPLWVNDNRVLAVPQPGGALALWDAGSGALLRTLKEDPNWQRTSGSLTALVNDWGPGDWSPDGRFFAIGVIDVNIGHIGYVVDTRRGRSASVEGHWMHFAGWSADSRYAVFYSENQYGYQVGYVFDTMQWAVVYTYDPIYEQNTCMSAMAACRAPSVEELLARFGALPEATP